MARTRVRGKVQGSAEPREKREIDEVVAAIRKKQGDHALVTGRTIKQPERLSTGIFTLDMALCGGIPRGKMSGFSGAKHSGKGGRATDHVLTPTGWVMYRDLKVGDRVTGSDGRPTTVTGVFPRGVIPTYRVSFTDGVSVVVDGDHLWYVQTRRQASKGPSYGYVVSTATLMAEALYDRKKGYKYRIPLISLPAVFDTVRLPMDPYLLGVFLANGSIGKGVPVFSTNDEDVVAEVRRRNPHISVKAHEGGDCKRWYVSCPGEGRNNEIKNILKQLGLAGKLSADKFIPDVYLRASAEDRLALLQALLDCDGSVTVDDGTKHHKGTAKYFTRSLRLLKGVQDLVWSLGGVAPMYTAERPDGIDYMLSVRLPLGMNPFLACEKKRSRYEDRGHIQPVRSIASIEPEGEEEVICISVAARDSLYVTESYVVTHNTTAMLKTIGIYQRRFPDEVCALVDAEHTYDPVWGEVHGVDNDRLLVVQPDTGEQAVDTVQALMHTLEIGLVGLDSIAALIPFKVLDTSAEDNATPGIHAKLTTQLVAKVNSALLKESKRGHYPTLLTTNQWRAKIGGWAPPGQEALGSPGGKAFEHYLSTHTIFKNYEKTGKDEQGFEMLEHNEQSFKIDKNKFNAGIRAGEFQMRRLPDPEFGLGEGDIDDAPTMLATAKKMGIYTGGGRAWTLELPGDETYTFANADEAIKFLYASRGTDEDVHRTLRNHLIALHAVKLGMPQYLIDSIYEM